MFESAEDITYALTTAGVELTFDSFNINAIMGFQTTALFDGDNIVNGTDAQEFNFYTSTILCIANKLIKGLTFTMQDTSYVYNFKTTSLPVPQLDGWSRFSCNLISKKAT